MLDYIKSALRKKQLITSDAEHLKGNCGNAKTSAFSFIVVNLFNKSILQALITTGV